MTLGGTVAYASRVAAALGYRPGVVTSCADDIDLTTALPDISVANVPAAESTTFENIYTETGRRQCIYGVAAPIGARDVPEAWRTAPIVHIAPLANELDYDILNAFNGGFIGVTPQGWMRRWNAAREVYAVDLDARATTVLAQADAVIMSEEDIPHPDSLNYFRNVSRLLVLTMGHNGCTLFAGDEIIHVPVAPVNEVDLTGAGDVFAAAFFIRLSVSGDMRQAAEYANTIASHSVQYATIETKVHQLAALRLAGRQPDHRSRDAR